MTLVSYYPQIFHSTEKVGNVATNNTDIQSIKLNIEGMVCSGCTENINHSVNKVDEIKKVIQSNGYLITNSKDR